MTWFLRRSDKNFRILWMKLDQEKVAENAAHGSFVVKNVQALWA